MRRRVNLKNTVEMLHWLWESLRNSHAGDSTIQDKLVAVGEMRFNPLSKNEGASSDISGPPDNVS
jgi:hypothetical protein